MKRIPLLNVRSLLSFRKATIALTVFSLATIVTLYSAPSAIQTAGIKLGATLSGHAMLNQMGNEIRSCKRVCVGNGNLESFAGLAENSLQQGNALKIYPDGQPENFILYYFDSGDGSLKRTVNGSGHVEILADGISNESVFFGEDYRGNTVMGNQQARVIRTTLELQTGQTSAGTSADSFAPAQQCRLQTRVAPRLSN